MSGPAGMDALLEVLHEDVTQSFARVKALFDRADELGINWSGDKEDTRRAAGRLYEHAESVRRLELVMPIVAPMKAGKSTLVNAIVGYPLLPARANPMTTLPTRIKLVEGLDLARPELVIPDSVVALFERMNEQIRRRMTEAGWTVPEAHSHLSELAESIKDGQAPGLRSSYQGGTAIRDVLVRLNDQLRLGVLATGETFLGDIRELPEISTGYRGQYTSPVTSGGQLVIVDTPGPNEHAMSAHLGPALEQQLNNSHVVLVVLDYTQMGGDAAAEIRDRLQAQLEVITTSKIFAVVNKVDERKKAEDLDREQTRAAVRAALGLSEEQSQAQVFETVARWGLIGTQMLADIEEFGATLEPASSESAAALLKEVRPFDWEDVLQDVTVDELKRDANRVLDRSLLAKLLNSAITRLRSGAAPTVIDSATRRYRDALAKLSGILALERNAAERGSAVVERELAQLSAEMQQLQKYRDEMPDARELERRFRDDLADFVRELDGEGHALIDVLEFPHEQPSAGFALTDAFMAVFRNTKRSLENLVRGKPDTEDVYEFLTLAEAEAFMTEMAGSVTEELRALLDRARRQIDKRARSLAAQVVAEQERKVRALVERAAQKLSAAFDVKLEVPSAVVNGELAVDLADPSVRSWSTQETYTTTERRRAWYKLWIGYHDVSVTRTRQVSQTRYQVSRGEVAAQLRGAFETHLAELRAGLDSYVADEVSDRLVAYYAGLTAYLESYHAALERSQDGFADDAAKQDERKRDLADLTALVAAEQDKLGDYQSRLGGYLGGSGNVSGPAARP